MTMFAIARIAIERFAFVRFAIAKFAVVRYTNIVRFAIARFTIEVCNVEVQYCKTLLFNSKIHYGEVFTILKFAFGIVIIARFTTSRFTIFKNPLCGQSHN